ncbi:site-specific DNA-methyltransferase [Ramlibacter ginsenosidimutans]|uniref:site-specific DNA-methyltransferase (adenine-specific) n=1 Tax=Ramlibacter ginsenosidimutans TaxID=502333 RepID=A0A934TQY1_9BURK|nr:site-specific DNA-methyltransferase [Ramlibacter ginsenosidimutans]MBK6005937.1 site-specific DNA-methyltransferase [Ramlibacter ginsenosidimutans]
MATKKSTSLTVETLTHDDATRRNIPTAEYQSVMDRDEQKLVRVKYARRNQDLDPQLVWRGKDEQDWSDLIVHAPPLYIQEKVHPKVLVDDLRRESERQREAKEPRTDQVDLFADFNGLPNDGAKTEFYQHDAHWANRMILGDSLAVMASLAEREGLRAKVQCIFFDPPYGIKFNSNFQWSTTSRDVKDGNAEHITREPEQVKAFRDTWRDGIHSYLTYIRDRLTVARDLLTDTGSVFVQIGDENVHRVRAVLDEVFGEDNFVSLIAFTKGATGLGSSDRLPARLDYIIWYSKRPEQQKFRQIFTVRENQLDPNFNWIQFPDGQFRRLTPTERSGEEKLPEGGRLFGDVSLTKPGPGRKFEIEFKGRKFDSGKRWWGMTPESLERALKTGRVDQFGNALRQLRYQDESTAVAIGNLWEGFLGQNDPVYVVQTNVEIVKRCILMSTDPGDLVLDPTCGSGTTAYMAEHWGRRWITIDTSRVALALARARIMGARYPYYLLADSRDGQLKEAEITRTAPSNAPTRGNVRHGFVYERVPHITLKSIAGNAEVDVIWEKYQQRLEALREQLNTSLGKHWPEWEIPRKVDAKWPDEAKKVHAQWWQERNRRQSEIDASIAAKAEFEHLCDKPYEDRQKVRVAGPFTVESLSPHRALAVDENDELIDIASEPTAEHSAERDFVQIILENLKTAGVQQAHKEDRVTFTSLTPWPGYLVCADGRYIEGTTEKRAAVFIGPEFGTVSRPDLVAAAREAGDAGFDVLIACAFNYDAHSSEFNKLGRIPVLKARMNADLHMAEDLKNTGKGNLFVIFGEPDIDVLDAEGGQVRIKVNGVDVFHPNSGEVRSDGAEGIACWFIDTDYNEESFFVRHAYFLGANDPYKSLKTTLKAEVSEDAWATLYSDTSRAFARPSSGRVAVKVINHLGDEVMKVFRV